MVVSFIHKLSKNTFTVHLTDHCPRFYEVGGEPSKSCFGELSKKEILRVFKDKPISYVTIFRVLKDCR